MAARTLMGWPVLMPPSIPPARMELRDRPAPPATISSWACEPTRPAVAKPSPTSTPFTDWMLMSARANRASSFRSDCT